MAPRRRRRALRDRQPGRRPDRGSLSLGTGRGGTLRIPDRDTQPDADRDTESEALSQAVSVRHDRDATPHRNRAEFQPQPNVAPERDAIPGPDAGADDRTVPGSRAVTHPDDRTVPGSGSGSDADADAHGRSDPGFDADAHGRADPGSDAHPHGRADPDRGPDLTPPGRAFIAKARLTYACVHEARSP